ncbi:MAG: hypothetical protein QM726_14775 [Chitinophagaceae bacterium]
MKHLVSFLLIIFGFANCTTNPEKKQTIIKADSVKLPAHQQYALMRLKQAETQNQGFAASDSFYLWSWNDFGKRFDKNRITRTLEDGFYYYSFWTLSNGEYTMYDEGTIPQWQVFGDTLYDVNGDNLKDLVVTVNYQNGQCEPDFNFLFALDSTTMRFKQIEAVSEISNSKFNPKKHTITSHVVCMCMEDLVVYKWNNDFTLSIIKQSSKNVCH